MQTEEKFMEDQYEILEDNWYADGMVTIGKVVFLLGVTGALALAHYITKAA